MSAVARGGAFFGTMVLMGSSLAMSCGGMAEDDGSGGTSSGGAASGGTSGSTGGSGGTSMATGGQPVGTGGEINPSSGGASGGTWGLGGFGGAYPTDCPTTQLHCTEPGQFGDCSEGFPVLPANCECDSTRPVGPDDCEAEAVFVCLGASRSAQGEVLDPIVPYDCECVPTEYSDCNHACEGHSESFGWAQCTDPNQVEPDLDAYLCGCALAILK